MTPEILSAIGGIAAAGLAVAATLSIPYLCGWKRLEKQYKTSLPPQGRIFYWHSIKVGIANFGGCVTIAVSPNGLYLKIARIFWGFSPILIPWKDLTMSFETSRIFRPNKFEFRIAGPRVKALLKTSPPTTLYLFIYGVKDGFIRNPAGELLTAIQTCSGKLSDAKMPARRG